MTQQPEALRLADLFEFEDDPESLYRKAAAELRRLHAENEAIKAQRQPLTERENELIDGMIEAQLYHAAQCDNIANRVMAEKQKGWDMERVELLRKLKAAHGVTGESK